MAKLRGNWFSCRRDQWTIDMVAEDLLISVVFPSRSIDESTSKDIEDAGLKEDQLLLVSLADRTV